MRGPGFCISCCRPCPGTYPDGICLLADRAEIDRRLHWLRTGVLPDSPGVADAALLVAAGGAVERAIGLPLLPDEGDPAAGDSGQGSPGSAPQAGAGAGCPGREAADAGEGRTDPPTAVIAGQKGWWKWRVWLDGMPLACVLAADAAEGWADVAVPNARGIVGQAVTRRRIVGSVEIRPMHGGEG